MTIVISLPDTFDIENYEGLQSFLVTHLQLDQDTTDQLPSLIRLAELRLDRAIQSPDREQVLSLTTTAARNYVTLPVGVRQIRQVKILGDETTGYPLAQVTPNVVETYDHAGRPVVYAVAAGRLYLGPIPDSSYTLSLLYMSKLLPLTQDRQTNWLLTTYADAYVYMACAVISTHLKDNEAAAQYSAFADAVIAEINEQAKRYRYSAPMRLRSTVVV